jgi:hypothetical protein
MQSSDIQPSRVLQSHATTKINNTDGFIQPQERQPTNLSAHLTQLRVLPRIFHSSEHIRAAVHRLLRHVVVPRGVPQMIHELLPLVHFDEIIRGTGVFEFAFMLAPGSPCLRVLLSQFTKTRSPSLPRCTEEPFQHHLQVLQPTCEPNGVIQALMPRQTARLMNFLPALVTQRRVDGRVALLTHAVRFTLQTLLTRSLQHVGHHFVLRETTSQVQPRRRNREHQTGNTQHET